MKEKIGMEKLQDLISEFINKTILPYDRGAECIKFENGYFYFRDGDCLIEDTIISARYGFIKWLVENDKIDKEKIIRAEIIPLKDVNENYLLMMLAIQEQPIEVLVSILK